MILQKTTRDKIRELIMEDVRQQRKKEGGPSLTMREMENYLFEMMREVGQDTLLGCLESERGRISTQKKTAQSAVRS